LGMGGGSAAGTNEVLPRSARRSEVNDAVFIIEGCESVVMEKAAIARPDAAAG